MTFAALLCAILLNAADMIFTLYAVANGFEEANPVMRYVLGTSVWWFFAVKALAVPFMLGVLYGFRVFNMAKVGLFACAFVYLGVVIYHFVYLAKI